MRTALLAVTALCLLAPALARADEPKKEPVYEGKTAGEWIKLLETADAEVRKRAVKALKPALGGDPAAVTALLRVFQDNNKESQVRIAAMEALSAAGARVVPHFVQALWDADPIRRGGAAFALCLMGQDARAAAVPLARALDSDLPLEFRTKVATALIDLENDDVVPVLVPMLDNPDVLVRFLAARVLASLETETARALATYRKLLVDENPAVRLEALSSLVILGPEAQAAVPDLVKLLADKGDTARARAAEALGAIGPGARAAAADLIRVLKTDGYSAVRLAAAEAAWRVARSPEVPAALKAMLKDDRFEDKLRTAELLWWTDRSTVAIKALTDSLVVEKRDGALAALLLAQIGPEAAGAAPTLGKWLDHDLENTRIFAAICIGYFGDAARPFVPRLVALAKEAKDPIDQAGVARSVWQVGPDAAAVELLKTLLAHESVKVRQATANKLHWVDRSKLKPLAPALQASLKDADGQVRADTAAALWKIEHSEGARLVLIEALTDIDPAARGMAAVHLGFVLGPDAKPAVPALVRALWDENPGVRSMAAEALARIGPAAQDAIPALVARIRTSGEVNAVYSAAAEALGDIGPAAKDALPELRRLLLHSRAHVRVNAAYALWRIDGDKAGERELTAGLGHRMGRTRGYAAEALWFIRKDPQSIPTLLHLLDQYDSNRTNEQYIAARALGRIGPPARAAIPALRRLLTQPDIDLVKTARDALKRIEGGTE